MNKALIAVLMLCIIGGSAAFSVDPETCFTKAATFSHQVKVLVSTVQTSPLQIANLLGSAYDTFESVNPLIQGCGLDFPLLDKVDNLKPANATQCFSKLSLDQYQNELINVYNLRYSELTANSSSKQQNTPQKYLFSDFFNKELFSSHIKNSSSFVIPEEKSSLLSEQNTKNNERGQTMQIEQNPLVNQKSIISPEILKYKFQQINDQLAYSIHQEKHNKQDTFPLFSQEKSIKKIETYSDFDNLMKRQSTNYSEYFNMQNRYRNLKQQNLGLEFQKAKYPPSINIPQNPQKSLVQPISNKAEILLDNGEKHISQLIVQNSQKEDKNHLKNFSFDEMEAFEEKNQKMNNQQQDQLDTDIEKDTQLFNSINLPQRYFKASNKGNLNCQNINEKNRDFLFKNNQKILSKESQKDVTLENKSYQNQEINLKVEETENENTPLLHNREMSQPSIDYKPQRKKKEKAKSCLKAYYEQNSEGSSNDHLPLEKQKRIQKQPKTKSTYKLTSSSHIPSSYLSMKRKNQLIPRKNKSEDYFVDKKREVQLGRQNTKGNSLLKKQSSLGQEKNHCEIDSVELYNNEEEDDESEEYRESESDDDEEEEEEGDDEEDDDDDEDETESDQSNNSDQNNLNKQSKRGQYKKYSIKLKKKLVNLLQKGEQPKDLSLKYDIPMKNLQRWKVFGAERREGGGRKIMDLFMEVILLEYCIDFTLRGRCRCPRKLIMQKAREFTKESSKFKGSKGWLDKYSTRTGLSKIMTEYKQLKVNNEEEIFKFVKYKSVEHIKLKIKQSNPLLIFTSQQYLKFLEQSALNTQNFWNIKISHYRFIASQYQEFIQPRSISQQSSQYNYFKDLIVSYKKYSDFSKLKELIYMFGIPSEYLLECLGLQNTYSQFIIDSPTEQANSNDQMKILKSNKSQENINQKNVYASNESNSNKSSNKIKNASELQHSSLISQPKLEVQKSQFHKDFLKNCIIPANKNEFFVLPQQKERNERNSGQEMKIENESRENSIDEIFRSYENEED